MKKESCWGGIVEALGCVEVCVCVKSRGDMVSGGWGYLKGF